MMLIITEKPSVARDFANALGVSPKGDGYFEGNGYVITWAIGHLLQPFYPEDYNPTLKKWREETLPIMLPRLQFKPSTKTKKQLSIIVRLLKRADIEKLLVATDAGREGELIARTIMTHSGVKKESLRFWTSQALSSEVIQETLSESKPLVEYDRLYHAGLARQYADWMVGINLTRIATIKLGDLYSIGRVQTAVLALLVKRFEEIQKFKSGKYWHLQISCDGLQALWFDPNKKENGQMIESLEMAKDIQKRIRDDVVVKNLTSKKKVEPSPPLFSLTELQRVANKEIGLSAKKTLELAQELYEKDKCLSYPRTDASVLGTKSFGQVKTLIATFRKKHKDFFNFFDDSLVSLKNGRVFNDAKLTDHHALIPLKSFNGSGDKRKVFDLILKRFISVFSKDHIAEETTVILSSNDDLFKSKGRVVLQVGWRHLDRVESDNLLPKLFEGEKIQVHNSKTLEKKTTPPPHYSDSSLLRDMSNPARHVDDKALKKVFRGEVGLGTQATRAQIIEVLIERKYIKRDQKKLIATEKGVFLVQQIRQMKNNSIIANPEETAKWEEDLEQISQGSGDVRDFVARIRDFVELTTSEWKGSSFSAPSGIATCPLCQGQVTEQKKSFSCINWKNGCGFTVWKKTAGKNIPLKVVKDIIEHGESQEMAGFKSKSGKAFNAKLKLQNGKIILDYRL